MNCVKECTAKAISPKETVKVTVAGKPLEWGKLDERKCSGVYQAGVPEYSPFMSEEIAKTMKGLLGQPDGDTAGTTAYSGNIWSYLREKMPDIRGAGKATTTPPPSRAPAAVSAPA